jgi:FKBP-type peptidyl-prolyl cis-trans isomerase 2
MSKAKNGDTVKIHYTGKLEDGKVFDDSRERGSFEFIVGNGDVMPSIEKGVLGMETGDTKTIEIPPEEAFGERREKLVVEIAKSELPNHITPTMGQRLQMRQPDGDHTDLIIIDVNEETITVDANHPLAGHTLFFDLELVEIA